MSITAYMYDYTDNEKILVTSKTVDYGNSSFAKNSVIWEKESLNYFFNLIDKNKKFNIIDIGGEKTIKKYKPIIQLEFNETNMRQCNIKPEQLLNYVVYII